MAPIVIIQDQLQSGFKKLTLTPVKQMPDLKITAFLIVPNGSNYCVKSEKKKTLY